MLKPKEPSTKHSFNPARSSVGGLQPEPAGLVQTPPASPIFESGEGWFDKKGNGPEGRTRGGGLNAKHSKDVIQDVPIVLSGQAFVSRSLHPRASKAG